MANIKSAQQHILINKRNRKKNVSYRQYIRRLFKNLEAMENPSQEELDKQISTIYSTLDRVSNQVIHQNKANRMKARAAQIAKQKAGK